MSSIDIINRLNKRRELVFSDARTTKYLNNQLVDSRHRRRGWLEGALLATLLLILRRVGGLEYTVNQALFRLVFHPAFTQSTTEDRYAADLM